MYARELGCSTGASKTAGLRLYVLLKRRIDITFLGLVLLLGSAVLQAETPQLALPSQLPIEPKKSRKNRIMHGMPPST